MSSDSRVPTIVQTLSKLEWRTWRFWRAVLFHPVFPIFVFILGSVYLKKVDTAVVRVWTLFPSDSGNNTSEQFESTGEFYPFSNFPMYANPRNRKLEYFFLEDGDGNPIPSFEVTGFTAARIKKKMISESKAWGKARGLRWNKKKRWLDDSARAEIGATLLIDLRDQTVDRGTPFAGTFRLLRGLIFVNEGGQLEVTKAVVASNAPPNP